MAINPADINTIRVGQLPPAPIELTDLIPHEKGVDLYQGSIQNLADAIKNYIGASASIAFLPITVLDGQTLPIPTQPSWILVGKGTFQNVNGGAPITTTEELNALIFDGTIWSIGVEIPIEVTSGGGTQAGDATATTKGILKLTGDLGGTADNPTTPTAIHKYLDIITDANDILLSMENNTLNFSIGSVALNRPPTDDWLTFQTTKLNDLYGGQICYTSSGIDPKIWIRVLHYGVWSQWVEFAIGSDVDLLSQIEVSTSTTIQEAWRGKPVLITAPITLTVPATLSENFAFTPVTVVGASIAWATTAPKTFLFGTPANTPEKSTAYFMQQGATNNIIILQ